MIDAQDSSIKNIGASNLSVVLEDTLEYIQNSDSRLLVSFSSLQVIKDSFERIKEFYSGNEVIFEVLPRTHILKFKSGACIEFCTFDREVNRGQYSRMYFTTEQTNETLGYAIRRLRALVDYPLVICI